MREPTRPTFVRGRVLLRAMLGIILLAVAGCFQVDWTINADGSGTLDLTYVPPSDATVQSESAKWAAPGVNVVSMAPRDGNMVAKIAFTDFAKLIAAPAMRTVRVRRDRVGDAERIRIAIRNPKPDPYATPPQVGTVALTLPGPVRFANRNAQKSGNRVTWQLPLQDIARHRWTKLAVAYAAAG